MSGSWNDLFLRDLLSQDTPEPPPPPDLSIEEPGPILDEDELRQLAQQRRTIEARRRGIRSLRIDPPTRSPGLGVGTGAGLRVI